MKQPRYGQIFAANPSMAETAKAVWQEVKLHLELHDMVSARRLAIADRYARACAEYEELHPIAAATGPVLVGPNGGDMFSFTWSAVEKLNDRMAKFEKALCLTPESSGDNAGSIRAAVVKTKADDYLSN